jgi:DNA-binding XRE family transcriptional regulator
MELQTTTRSGKEYYLVPAYDNEEMQEMLDLLYCQQAYDTSKVNGSDAEPTYPAELVFAIAEGKNPVFAYREHQALTQQQLADKAGVSRVMISEIESGKKDGSIKTIKALAKALNVDIDDLV